MTVVAQGRLRRFGSHLRPFAASLSLLGVSVAGSVLITLPIPWLEKNIVDNALSRGDASMLFRLLAIILALYLGMRLLVFARGVLSVRLRQKVLTALRLDLFSHLQRMSPAFFAKHPVGNLLSRLTSDIGYVQSLLSDELFEVVASMAKIATVVGLLIAISPKLTILCAAVLPIVVLVYAILRPRIYQHNLRLQESQEKLSGSIAQSIAGMRLIQAETIEERMWTQTLDSSRRLERVAIRRELLALLGNLATTVFSYLPFIALLWGYGGILVIEKQLTLGALLAFTQYVLGLIAPATRFFQFNMSLQAGYAALDRIYEILDTPPDIEDSLDAQVLDGPIETIEFDHVSLSYFLSGSEGIPSRIQALRDVSFVIRRGEKVALVGPSGSGKSSVIHLLLRFYEPTSGEIRINGRPLRRYTLQSLRKAIAFVAQDSFIFGASIRDNVALGKPIDDATLLESLDLAAATEFLEGRGCGLDSVVSTSGADLSGGQKQRLSLARAVAKRASFYAFDEATSALDNPTERAVFDRLRRFLEDKTALIVAHRLSCLLIADRILVLSDGMLVEDGTQDELLSRRGLFAALVAARKGEDI